MWEEPKHPGQLFMEECLNDCGLTIDEVAKEFKVSRNKLLLFLQGGEALDPMWAKRISIATGTSSEYWLRLQIKYDLWLLRNTKFNIQPFLVKES